MYAPNTIPPKFSEESLAEEINAMSVCMADLLCDEKYDGVNGIIDIIEPVFMVGAELVCFTIWVKYEVGQPTSFSILDMTPLCVLN